MPWVSWVSSLPTGNLGLLRLFGSVSLENLTHTSCSLAGLSREATTLTPPLVHSHALWFPGGCCSQGLSPARPAMLIHTSSFVAQSIHQDLPIRGPWLRNFLHPNCLSNPSLTAFLPPGPCVHKEAAALSSEPLNSETIVPLPLTLT